MTTESAYRPRPAMRKAPKLRASCDACSSAKVRCTQTKPSCSRCAKHGVECVYGISRRSGKRSAESYEAMRRNAAMDSGSDTSSMDMDFHETSLSKPSDRLLTTPSSLDMDMLNSPVRVNSTGLPTPPANKSMDFLDSPASSRMPDSPCYGQYPDSPDSIPELPDYMNQQFKDWGFDSMLMPNLPTPIISPATSFCPSVFENKEIHLANFQPQYTFTLPEHLSETPQCFKPGSIYSASPMSESELSEFESGEYSDAPMPSIESDSYFDHQPQQAQQQRKTSPCSTCSSSGPKPKSSTSRGCRCNESIISHISYFPEVQDDQRSYDMDLAQMQEALKLGSDVLNCACAGKDYAVGLSMSLLVARIVSVLEQLCRRAREEDEAEAEAFGRENDLCNSPRFALGMYQIAKEDERRLKQEMLGLQIKKAECLISCCKDMMARLGQKQARHADTQAVVSEKLFSLLEERVLEVRKEWSGI